MPSGPKKRKAAKKKKEKEAHNNNSSVSINSNTPQGNEDPKSRDERESEGSEVASPVSQDQDHNRQHPFAEESEKGASGDAERSNAGQGDGEVEKEPKTVQNVERNGISVKCVDSMKEPHYGNEKSSSSSSSDDESQTDAKKEEKTHDSVSIAISHRDEEKKVDTISEVVLHISGKGKPLKEANNNSDVEPAPVINSDMPVVPMSEVVRPVVENLQVESSEFAVSASIENMNKILPVSSETSGVPLGLLSEKGDDSLDEKLTFVEVTSAAATSNDVQIAKESETRECHETRPLVDSAPQLAQRTTWMSCCGLFEAFTGSSR